MRKRSLRYLAGAMALAFILAACGGAAEESGGEADEAAGTEQSGGGTEAAGGTPSIASLDMTFEAERSTQLMDLMAAKERTWDDTFESVNLIATEEPIPALISGSAWIVQNEPITLWPALEQGVVDGVLVGVFNDTDAWYVFTKEEIDTPEKLIGSTFSGGPVGDSWNTVAEIIMTDEFGIDPDEVEFVAVGDGSDGRVEAFLAGQIDGFMGQPRHIPLVEEAGGNILYGEIKDMAQGMFMVERETMENNKDAVCAALRGLFEANQWFANAEEDDWRDRQEQTEEYLTENGYDPGPSGLDIDRTWAESQEAEFNWALDLGAPVEAWDRQQEIMSREDGGEISADFDWRDHVDFSCIWELQEEAGLPLNPDPDEL